MFKINIFPFGQNFRTKLVKPVCFQPFCSVFQPTNYKKQFPCLPPTLRFLENRGSDGKMTEKMRNNDFHQMQPGHAEKTSVLGNWANFEVDRTKKGMYVAIQFNYL